MPHGDLAVGADGLYTTADDLVKWDSWLGRMFLTPIGDDLFSADDGYYLIAFTRDKVGGITGFRLPTPRAKRIEFLRHPGASVPSEDNG